MKNFYFLKNYLKLNTRNMSVSAASNNLKNHLNLKICRVDCWETLCSVLRIKEVPTEYLYLIINAFLCTCFKAKTLRFHTFISLIH